MRRPVLAFLAAAALATATGCAHAATTPTIPSVDFSPDVEVHVPQADDLRVTGPGGTTTIDHVTATAVIVVTNDGRDDRRLIGVESDAQVFDTGTIAAGDAVTVVVPQPGELAVRETTTDRRATLTINPKPG